MRESIEAMLSDFIEQNSIATDDEIRLVSDINGWTEETMFDIIFRVLATVVLSSVLRIAMKQATNSLNTTG